MTYINLATKVPFELAQIKVRYSLSTLMLSQLVSSGNEKLNPMDGFPPSLTEAVGVALRAAIRQAMPNVSEARLTEIGSAFNTVIVAGISDAIKALPYFFLNMALIYRCALFDAYMNDVLQLLLMRYPGALKSNETLTYKEIVDAAVNNRVLETIVDKKLLSFGHSSIVDQSKWLAERYGLSFANGDRLKELIEVMARRNLLVHSNGVVNQKYNSDTGQQLKSGEVLFVDKPYWARANEVMTATEDDFYAVVVGKFTRV